MRCLCVELSDREGSESMRTQSDSDIVNTLYSSLDLEKATEFNKTGA